MYVQYVVQGTGFELDPASAVGQLVCTKIRNAKII